MTKLVMMVGIPGCGKSTYIKTHATSKDKIISRDNIRFNMVSENKPYFDKEKKVFKEYIQQIQKAIDSESYEKIYLDATQINEVSRNKVLNRLNNLDKIELQAIVFNTSTEIAVKRNNKRIGRYKVPEEVIYNMDKRKTNPALDKKYKYIIKVV